MGIRLLRACLRNIVGQASSLSGGGGKCESSHLLEGDSHWTGWKPVPLRKPAILRQALRGDEHLVFITHGGLKSQGRSDVRTVNRLMAACRPTGAATHGRRVIATADEDSSTGSLLLEVTLQAET